MKTASRPREIQKTVMALLNASPLVANVEPFGSLANSTDDRYSDIDLRVHVSDIPAAVSRRHVILNDVAKEGIEWPVHLHPGSFCSSILLAGESCYHKIDLEFCAVKTVSGEAAEAAALEGYAPSGLYLPTPNTPGHFLVGQLLGGTRYAKARKREQHLTCWRFCSAMIDWLCTLLYEEEHQWQNLGRKLTTDEYQWLDGTSAPGMGVRFCEALDLSTPARMDSAVLSVLHRVVALSMKKGEDIGAPIPKEPISRLLMFLKSELGTPENDKQ